MTLCLSVCLVNDCLSVSVHLSVSQFMAVGLAGPLGLSVLGVLMNSMVIKSSPSEFDIVHVLTPPLPVTRCLTAIVALEMRARSWTAANSPTVQVREGSDQIKSSSFQRKPDMFSDWLSLQWTAAGGRGLCLHNVPSPVGRGFSCQLGGVIAPPLNMVAATVRDQAQRAVSVRAPAPVTHKHTHACLYCYTCEGAH